MSLRPPARNLGPGEAWGRWTENQIKTLMQESLESSQSVDRSLRGVNGSLAQLSGQIDSLLTVQNELLITQSILADQQTQLAATQAALPIPDARHSEGNGALGSGTTLSQSFTVPTGKTRASVQVKYRLNYLMPTTTNYMRSRAVIAGVNGPQDMFLPLFTNGANHIFLDGFFGRDFSVTGGQTFSVDISIIPGANAGAGINPTKIMDTLCIFS